MKLGGLWFSCVLMIGSMPSAVFADGSLAFEQKGYGVFRIDTGVIRGVLRKGGQSHGLADVVHVPTGTKLSRARGWAGHYRILTTDKRHKPDAWYMPSTAELQPDGSVQVKWAADKKHRYEMTVTYRFVEPAVFDVETVVTAKEELEDFEVIIPSYFGQGFNESRVYAVDAGAPCFIEAGEADGYWQMFPRDDKKWGMVKDGRWDHPPHKLDWVKRPNLAKPLAMRKHNKSKLSALVMALPNDVQAVGTPFSGEYHLSNYFVLFGRTVKKGESVRAHVRIVLVSNLSEENALDLYEAFVKEAE